MSVLVVAILLAQACWFWPTFPGGDWVCSEQLIPAETHLHHLALHHHCFCPRFNTCWSSQSEESLMIFLFSKRKPSAHMPYAWMFLDMAVTWAIQKLPISNQPLGICPWVAWQPPNLWIYDPPEMAELKLIWSATIRHKEKSLSPTQKSWPNGWKHWGEDFENQGWSELQ